MGLSTTIITFGATAVQFPVPSGLATVHTILAEPLRTNAHVCYIGGSNVTNDASGTGVIRELAQPGAATVPVDQFVYQPSSDGNRADPTDFYVHGTSGEKIKLSYLKV